MSILISNSEQLCKLKIKIDSGTRIILVDCFDSEIISLLLSSIKKNRLTDIEVWHCADYMPDKLELVCLSNENMFELLGKYRMYDFSDKILVISDTDQYGCLLNYVKTGFLTKQEMVDALLYNLKTSRI